MLEVNPENSKWLNFKMAAKIPRNWDNEDGQTLLIHYNETIRHIFFKLCKDVSRALYYHQNQYGSFKSLFLAFILLKCLIMVSFDLLTPDDPGNGLICI